MHEPQCALLRDPECLPKAASPKLLSSGSSSLALFRRSALLIRCVGACAFATGVSNWFKLVRNSTAQAR